jgi:hypothetical protein
MKQILEELKVDNINQMHSKMRYLQFDSYKQKDPNERSHKYD